MKFSFDLEMSVEELVVVEKMVNGGENTVVSIDNSSTDSILATIKDVMLSKKPGITEGDMDTLILHAHQLLRDDTINTSDVLSM